MPKAKASKVKAPKKPMAINPTKLIPAITAAMKQCMSKPAKKPKQPKSKQHPMIRGSGGYEIGFRKFDGNGDYVANEIVHSTGYKLPMHMREDNYTISNSEFILDLSSPGSAFTVNSLFVNPGDGSTFPWLSQVAQRFQRYRFTQLVFEFRTDSSDYSANTGLGTVIMAPQYNPLLPTFTAKQQMEGAKHAISAKPSHSIYCGVECSEKETNYRWYTVRQNGDIVTVTSDQLEFLYGSSGFSAAVGTGMGELWVHYTVKLLDPFLPAATAVGLQVGNITSIRPATQTATFGQTPFGLTQAMIASVQQYFAQNASGAVLPKLSIGAATTSLTLASNYAFGQDAAYTWVFNYPGTYTMSAQLLFDVALTANSGNGFTSVANNCTVTYYQNVGTAGSTASDVYIFEVIVKVNPGVSPAAPATCVWSYNWSGSSKIQTTSSYIFARNA